MDSGGTFIIAIGQGFVKQVSGLIALAGNFRSTLTKRCGIFSDDWGRTETTTMNVDKINAAVIQCLEHAATSPLPPAAAAADFLRLLLADGAFTPAEVDSATLTVSRILKGIAGRQEHNHPL